MTAKLGVEREGARGDLDRHRRAGAVADDQHFLGVGVADRRRDAAREGIEATLEFRAPASGQLPAEDPAVEQVIDEGSPDARLEELEQSEGQNHGERCLDEAGKRQSPGDRPCDRGADQQGAEDQNKKGDPGIDDKGGEMPVQPDQLLDNAAAQRLDQSAKKQRQANQPAAREIAVHEIVPEQYLVIRFGMPGRLPSADAPAD